MAARGTARAPLVGPLEDRRTADLAYTPRTPSPVAYGDGHQPWGVGVGGGDGETVPTTGQIWPRY